MSNKKILIIGHEVPFENTIQSIINDVIQCKITIYYPSYNFINYIQEYNPTLIIATSGSQESLIQEIKKDNKLKNIPIFLLSGYYDKEDVLASAADEFQSKPADIEIFLEKVKKYIN